LLKSVVVDPGFVNAYYQLAEAADYARLREIWAAYGGRDVVAGRFLDQYASGADPYEIPAAWLDPEQPPALIVRVADELDAVDVLEYDSGEVSFVGRLPDPQLICSPRDFGALPAAKKTVAEDLVKLGKDRRLVGHGSTWVQVTSRNVFGPAIDTVYYHQMLRRHVFPHAELAGSVRTVLEIGTGTGFLLCSVARHWGRDDLCLTGNDRSPDACRVAGTNLRRTLHGAGGRASVWQHEAALATMPDRSVDLLFTNPPYIPTFDTPLDGSAYATTTVLEQMLLRDGPRVLAPDGVLLVLYSSLAATTVERFFARTPLCVQPLGEPRRVPLDLREVTRRPAWIAALREAGGLDEELEHPDYTHWHTLRMAALYHPGNRFRRADGTVFSP
jgi:SAM-dependent methyltransferase